MRLLVGLYSFIGYFLFFIPYVKAQEVQIWPGIPSKGNIAKLFGPGVEIDTNSIRLVGAAASIANYVGGQVFSGARQGKGIILSTGNAQLAQGINQGRTISVENQCFAQKDQDLEQAFGGISTGDVVYLECRVRFSSGIFWVHPFYLASEEYPEEVFEEPTDVFAIFLSTPAAVLPPLGYRNIALFPPSNNVPITYATVNRLQNPAFYQTIPIGKGPVGYNGISKALALQQKVIPGVWYWLKIAVGDRKDCALDSGVFLEQESFRSPGVFFEAPAQLCIGSKGIINWRQTNTDYLGNPIFSAAHTLILEISDPNGNFDGGQRELARIQSNAASGSIIFDLPPNLPNSSQYLLRIRTIDPSPLLPSSLVTAPLITEYISPIRVSIIRKLPLPNSLAEYVRCSPGVIAINASGTFPSGTFVGIYSSAQSLDPLIESSQAPYQLQTFVLSSRLFYLRARLGSCFSDAFPISARIIELPTPPESIIMRCGPSEVTFTYAPPNSDVQGLALYTTPEGGSPLATAEGNPLYLTTPVIGTTGVYYLEAYNRIVGCRSLRSSLVIAINPNIPPPPPLIVIERVCNGDSLKFQVPSGITDGDFIRIYETAQGGLPILALPIQEGRVHLGPIIQQNKTLYFAAVYSATGCESQRVSEFIRPLPRPKPPIFQEPGICGGGKLTLRIFQAEPNLNDALRIYTTETGTPYVIEQKNTSLTWQTPHLTTTTTFYVATYGAQTACESPRVPLRAIVYPLPPTPTPQLTKLERCGEGNITITVRTSFPPPFEIALYTTAQASFPIATQLQTQMPYQIAAMVEKPETLYVAIKEIRNGCISETRSPVVIDLLPLPTPPRIVPQSRCGSGNVEIEISASSPTLAIKLYENLLSPSAMAIDSFSTFRLRMSVTQSTTFYVTRVSSPLPGCESPRTALPIEVKQRPPQPISSNFFSCGNSVITLTATTTSPDAVIRLYEEGGALIAQSNSSSLTFAVVLQGPRRFIARSFSSVTGCESEETPIWVSIASAPPKPLVEDTIRCGTGSHTLRIANGIAGNRYLLFLEPLNTLVSSMEGSTNTLLTTPSITQTTQFRVIAVNSSSGCSSAVTRFAVLVLTSNPLLKADAGADKIIPCGGSTQIGSAFTIPGANYLWQPTINISNPLISNPTVSPNQETTYTLTVTQSGCTARDEVTVRPIITNLSLRASTTQICRGQSTVLIATGAESYRWNPSIGLSHTIGSIVEATPPSTITYTVVATQGNCVGREEITITVHPVAFNVVVTPTATQTGSLLIEVTQGLPPFLYSIGGNIQNQNLFTGLAPGSYWINVQDSRGCTHSQTVEVPRIPARCGGITNIRIIEKTATQATLTWEPALNAQYYDLSFRKVGAPNFSSPIRVNGTTFTLTNLENNAQYEVRIRSICLAGFSESPYETINFRAVPCEEVSGITVVESTATTLSLRWQRNFDNTAYRIEYRPTPAAPWQTQITTQNEIILRDLSPSTNYEIRIQSICSNANSIFQTLRASTISCPSVLFNQVIITPASLDFSWQSHPTARAYEFNYRLQGTTNWTTQRINTPNFTLLAPIPDATYEVQVRSICGDNSFSEYTTLVLKASPEPGPCNTPLDFNTQNLGTNALGLRWNLVMNALYYLVRYRALGERDWKMVQANTNIYTLENLLPNTPYELQVATACVNGFSSWSPSINRTTLATRVQNIASAEKNLTIYPNPNRGIFTLQLPNYESEKEWDIYIFNSLGKKVNHQKIISPSTEVELNLSELVTPGQYYIKLVTENQNWNINFVVIE
ncbi:MAG: choice-of-anchor L domain-containing protein [Bacteroidia bacterium]|nr:choice-of-anchor L domain-containing protein [Bacteroidia bacterium]